MKLELDLTYFSYLNNDPSSPLKTLCVLPLENPPLPPPSESIDPLFIFVSLNNIDITKPSNHTHIYNSIFILRQ